MTDEDHTMKQERLPPATVHEWFNAWYGSLDGSNRWHTIEVLAHDPIKTVEFTVRCGVTRELIEHGYHAFTMLEPGQLEETTPLAQAIHNLCASAVRDVPSCYEKPECTLDIRVAPTSSEDGYAVWYHEVHK